MSCICHSEGVRWGKFIPPSEGGRFAKVHADATLVWSLLMKVVFEQLDSTPRDEGVFGRRHFIATLGHGSC